MRALPNITITCVSDWVYRRDFHRYGFQVGNGFARYLTPERFPQGLLWDIRRLNDKPKGKVLRVRCLGIDPDFVEDITNAIRADIRAEFKDQPCFLTGVKTSIEIDHRAGNKLHPLHKDALDPKKQTVDQFMPLCRTMNQLKREQCKNCIATGQRPNLPGQFGGGPMPTGEGCHGCYWFEPESFVP